MQQCARDTLDPYGIFLFDNQNTNSIDVITATCKLKVSIAPETSVVYLQIYNRNTTTWETIDQMPTMFGTSLTSFGDVDAVYGTIGENVEFTLSGVVATNLSDYYDGNNWASFRVYQEVKQ